MTKYCYEYPRPMVTVDVVLIYTEPETREQFVLLIKRKNDPYRDNWALPGGFVDMDETVEHAAMRELEEETGVTIADVHLFGVFSKPGRDPRGRTITASYTARTSEKLELSAGDDAAQAQWHNVNNLSKLAFDHNEMITAAIRALDKNIFLFSQ